MAILNYDAGPERVPVMILYVETRGFTRISAILQPSVVLARISEFFAMVTAAVERHQGMVPNIFNDTLAATFTGPDNAEQAARTALEIRQDFGSVAEAWERDYSLHAAVAMGLHSGEVVIGPAGASVPGQQIVIGDSLSITERLLHRARAGEFVLSRAFMDALATTRFSLDAVELPALRIPPREPISIFGVLLDTRLDFT